MPWRSRLTVVGLSQATRMQPFDCGRWRGGNRKLYFAGIDTGFVTLRLLRTDDPSFRAVMTKPSKFGTLIRAPAAVFSSAARNGLEPRRFPRTASDWPRRKFNGVFSRSGM